MIRRLFDSKVLRYLISGGTAALIQIASLYGCVTFLHLPYLIGTTIAFLLTLCVSFVLQKFWTFSERTTDTMHQQAGGYALLSFVNIFVNGALMYLFVSALHIQYLIGQVLTIGIIALYGFFIYRYLIFIVRRPEG